MRRHFDVTAPSVHQMVMSLEKAGLIARTPGALEASNFWFLGRGKFLPTSFDPPARNPKRPRRGYGIDSPLFPPGDFVTEPVIVTVMSSAKRDRELVADLAPQRAELSERRWRATAVLAFMLPAPVPL
jgi:hypothetical protein